jgi:hypothetical protein
MSGLKSARVGVRASEHPPKASDAKLFGRGSRPGLRLKAKRILRNACESDDEMREVVVRAYF